MIEAGVHLPHGGHPPGSAAPTILGVLRPVVAVHTVCLGELSAIRLGVRLGILESKVHQPGNLRVRQAVLENPAHVLDLEAIEQLLLEVVFLRVVAQVLDDLIAHHRIGLRVLAAGPQTGLVVHAQGRRHHHLAIDELVGRLALGQILLPINRHDVHELLDGARVARVAGIAHAAAGLAASHIQV